MTKTISFIHAADLHLDSPFRGLAHTPAAIFEDIKESTFKALDRLVVVAIEKKVDFIMLVGDLFDNERQSLKAQIRLRNAFETLAEHDIQVYLSYGNHDHLSGNHYPVTYPENVYEFASETVETVHFMKDEAPLAAIQGFSYENRAVLTNKTAEFNVTDRTIPFHIAMLHGSLQSNKDHDTYAPFQLSELINTEFDYWALGHIHQRAILHGNPLIVYPGNIQGRHRKEKGEKGCYHVTLTETTQTLNFMPLQALQFNELTLDVSHCSEVHQLETVLYDAIKTNQATTPQLLDLTLTSHDPHLTAWKHTGKVDEIVELINERLMNEVEWDYIFRLAVMEYQGELDISAYEGDHFLGVLAQQFTEHEITDDLIDLFEHRQGRKYVSRFSEAERAEIKAAAQQLLLTNLLSERR